MATKRKPTRYPIGNWTMYAGTIAAVGRRAVIVIPFDTARRAKRAVKELRNQDTATTWPTPYFDEVVKGA